MALPGLTQSGFGLGLGWSVTQPGLGLGLGCDNL